MGRETITLTYDPFSLPTSQHRAGLAGLLVLIDTMKNRGYEALPEIEGPIDGYFHVTFTEESLGLVFRELYDALLVESPRNKKKVKRTGGVIQPKREETLTDIQTGKEKTIFVYDEIVPKASFLQALQMPDAWLDLWREVIWYALRHRDRSRRPYQDIIQGKRLSEADKNWQELLKLKRATQKQELRTEDISGSLYLGAQACNAELVPFKGRVEQNLMLHFWPIVMGVFEPEMIDREGHRTGHGYALVIPDVSDFRKFVILYKQRVAEMSDKTFRGRPVDSIISIPQEGALEYVYHLMSVAKSRHESSDITYTVRGFDVLWVLKVGRDLRILSSDRIGISEELLDQYDAVRGYYRHPLFRGQLILNLLRERPWYYGFDQIFATNDQMNFLGDDARDFILDSKRRLARN